MYILKLGKADRQTNVPPKRSSTSSSLFPKFKVMWHPLSLVLFLKVEVDIRCTGHITHHSNKLMCHHFFSHSRKNGASFVPDKSWLLGLNEPMKHWVDHWSGLSQEPLYYHCMEPNDNQFASEYRVKGVVPALHVAVSLGSEYFYISVNGCNSSVSWVEFGAWLVNTKSGAEFKLSSFSVKMKTWCQNRVSSTFLYWLVSICRTTVHYKTTNKKW